MGRKREYSKAEQVAVFVILGILFWCWGLGFVSFLLWALLLAGLVPERWWPKTRFEKRIEAQAAERIADDWRARKRLDRRKDMEYWDHEFRYLEARARRR
jgi:hypothetical protein